jgi:glutamate dehydrogenase/leucine dehydrogenase
MSENLDPFTIAQQQLYDACKIVGYDQELYDALSEPERFVQIKIVRSNERWD